MTNDSHRDDEESALDERIRRALEPPPHVTSRLVASATGARTPGATRRIRRLPRGVAVGAAIVLVAGVLVGGLMWSRERGANSRRGMVTNEGGIMVIEMRDRPITLIAPRAMTTFVPSGTVSIVLLGESQ